MGGVTVEQGFKKLLDGATPKYNALLAFLFDTGIRCPTELVNVKRKDISPIAQSPFFSLNIRQETSKTFGRTIKLMFCHEILRENLIEGNFQPDASSSRSARVL